MISERTPFKLSRFFAVTLSFIPCLCVVAEEASPEHAHGHRRNSMGDSDQNQSGFMSNYAYPLNASECPEMTVWDLASAMCMPLPMPRMPMKMVMAHANIFGVGVVQEGPRGRDAIVSPNMVMIDAGSTAGDMHYFNLDLMGTFEKWTFPARGYPEIAQIGEHDQRGVPYLDGQHPHSSPIMGLTLSETIKIGEGRLDHLKVFFAPRGQSTDGPIAFMHRPIGLINPVAPLGHHIGQDVGHISSTVIGASLKTGNTRIEASTFNGTEPEPTKVDLPISTPNSYALRLVEEFSPSWMAMVSAAYVKDPEPDDPDLPFVARYSASVYTDHQISETWRFHTASIFGLITKYDHASSLASFNEEFWLHDESSRLFGRFEVLQRTPGELAIPLVPDQNSGKWIFEGTLG